HGIGPGDFHHTESDTRFSAEPCKRPEVGQSIDDITYIAQANQPLASLCDDQLTQFLDIVIFEVKAHHPLRHVSDHETARGLNMLPSERLQNLGDGKVFAAHAVCIQLDSDASVTTTTQPYFTHACDLFKLRPDSIAR